MQWVRVKEDAGGKTSLALLSKAIILKPRNTNRSATKSKVSSTGSPVLQTNYIWWDVGLKSSKSTASRVDTRSVQDSQCIRSDTHSTVA